MMKNPRQILFTQWNLERSRIHIFYPTKSCMHLSQYKFDSASPFTSWVIPEKFPPLFAWLNGPWGCLNSVGYSNRVVPLVGREELGCILSWLDRITALLDSWNFSFLFRPFLSPPFPFSSLPFLFVLHLSESFYLIGRPRLFIFEQPCCCSSGDKIGIMLK